MFTKTNFLTKFFFRHLDLPSWAPKVALGLNLPFAYVVDAQARTKLHSLIATVVTSMLGSRTLVTLLPIRSSDCAFISIYNLTVKLNLTIVRTIR
jgi:hypothetical protein